jgi:hypothetical protein
MDASKIRALHEQIRDIGPEASTLPLPRRFGLTPLRLMNEAMMGDSIDFFKDHARRETSTSDMLAEFLERKDLLGWLNGTGMSFSDMRMMHIRARHQYSNAPIFTVAPGLKSMLEDTRVKDNIPAKFFAPPFRTSYLEFEPAEDRRVLVMTKPEQKDLVEGCYLQERLLDKLPEMTRDEREFLHLDPNAPVRVIDVAFTYSGMNSSLKQVQNTMPVIADKMDYIQLFIQDETEPVAELLERAVKFSMSRSNGKNDNGLPDMIASNKFAEVMRENFSKLSKILFYMHVDRKSQVKQTPAKDLEERIRGVGDKKKPKLERMLTRTYDRIVVGPMTYVPISQRVAAEGGIKGHKAPHYRSGYFGIRWKGHGQAKTPELVRVSEARINEHLLTTRPEREYEIR